MALRGGKASHPLCPSPSASTLVPSSPTSERAAPSRVVRQALERALLITHRQFWDKYMPERKDLGKADITRRKVLAMQFYMRLYILVAFQGALTSTACFFCFGHVYAVLHALGDIPVVSDSCSEQEGLAVVPSFCAFLFTGTDGVLALGSLMCPITYNVLRHVVLQEMLNAGDALGVHHGSVCHTTVCGSLTLWNNGTSGPMHVCR